MAAARVIRTPHQLAPLMRAYRLKAGLSQAALAARLGISRQAVTALEKAPEAATFERLMKVWALLGIEVSLQEAASVADKRTTGLEW
ncbi:helix-turn-helix domain-containing protein [Stenotrophomonas sp. CFBP 13725]|uniref:helix-turn-helix domain-containing protein n=1 Tax=Stenotrophomonas sp. CFBP 13725 TaxID=2775297 RepID=UPI0017874535|nr:helix-turn-helix domain-containing protein [Stenotrophomonas sp. CFBP 13725]MBD8637778.1 helix-turn-helix domain-containing protein [Stenotrophomonas sp. CFBP 13725]